MMAKIIVEKGVLSCISSGTSYDRANLHEFIEIGGKRILQVAWSEYMDNFIRKAVGKEAQISLLKRGNVYLVAAVEYDGKIEREVRPRGLGYSQLGFLGRTALITVGVSLAVGMLSSWQIAVGVFFFTLPASIPFLAFRSWRQGVAAAKALG